LQLEKFMQRAGPVIEGVIDENDQMYFLNNRDQAQKRNAEKKAKAEAEAQRIADSMMQAMEAENAAKMDALRREMQAEKDAQEAARMVAQREMEE